MSKHKLLIMSLCATLCSTGICAQNSGRILTIDELYTLADANSKRLRTDAAAVSEAEQSVREAKNGRLPDIGLSVSASYLGNGNLSDRDFSNGTGIKMPHFGNNFAVEATQLIYGGGVVNSAVAMAKLQHEMAGVQYEQSRSDVRFMLTGFYLDLFKMRNMMQVYDRNIKLTEQIIAETESRNREGVVLQNDITRYELQLSSLKLSRTQLYNSIDILNSNMTTMLDMPTETDILPDTTILDGRLPVETEYFWQQLAETESQRLRQGSLAVEMGKRQEQLIKAERMPKVALVAANHFDGPITIEVPVINKNFNYWYVGVGVSFKLSSLYKTGKSVRRAELSTQKSNRELESMQEQVYMDVKSDYIRYVEARQQMTTFEKSVSLARQNYDVINTRYANGMVLITDMLDASNQLLDAELQLVNAQINIIYNYYKLLHTAGDL